MRKRTFRAATFVVVAMTCLAGARPAPYTLQGRVWDRSTGAPVGGATVSLIASRRSTVTEDDGSFTFEDLQVQGSEQLQIAHDEYRTVRLSLGSFGSGPVTLVVALTGTVATLANPGGAGR